MSVRWLSFLGGLLGGFGLVRAPLENSFLSGLDPIVDGIGIIAILIFSGAMIYSAVRDWFQG
ncbi:hypothetical protein ACAF76_016640 [Brevibacillus sp. TJ4]|uniref:hypothetical protein n=1 Tax=Brevibacillus sp. TJ4 TaxID=3234853 RepID=UPI0037D05EED